MAAKQTAKQSKQTAVFDATRAVSVVIGRTTPIEKQHGFVERCVDTELAALLARGGIVNVADVAVATAAAPSKPAAAISEALAKRGIVIAAGRVQADLRYTLGRTGGHTTDAKHNVTAYIPRALRSAAASVASERLAASDKPAAAKRTSAKPAKPAKQRKAKA